MDTSPIAVALFGRPIERALKKSCSRALSKLLTGMDMPLGIPCREEQTEGPIPTEQTVRTFLVGLVRRPAVGIWGRRILKSIAYAHIWYILVVALLLVVYRRVDPPSTVLMTYRVVMDGWEMAPHKNVSLAKIPSLARRMVVSVEDGKFYKHHGIDFEAIQYAMQVNKQVGSPLYGGSTISMQTARTLFLVPFKSYLRKYLEVIATLEMEIILPKERILEIYLSWAEWGKGVFGLEAASRKYYGKSASRLDLDQTARLVALLSSPIRYTPSTLQKNGILRSRYQYLIRKYGSS